MEFLKGLKQALDMGLSKDEFKNIWAEEMRSRVGASATDSSQETQEDTQDTVSSARDMGVMTDPVREDNERASLRTALTEMTGQLKQMALQQGQLKDQMKVFHESNQQLRQHLLNSQQQQTKRQEALNEKFSKMENAINNMENSFVKSVQKCFEKEGISLKEEMSLTVETHHNHTRDQLQKLRAAIVNEICERVMQDVEKTFDEKAKEIVAESLTSLKEQNVEDDEEEEESSDEYCSAENDSGDEGDDGLETKGKQSVHNMTTQVTESSVKITKSNDRVIKNNISPSVTGARVTLEKKAACDNVPEKINQETSLPSKSPRKIRAWKRSTKAVLHGELNAFMADIQKLILKPLTSKDLVHQFVEGVGGLLNSERNFLSDLFQEVQTAIGSEIQARFYKMEQSIKQEIVTAVQPFPQYEAPEDCHLYRPAAELYGSQTSLVSADTDTQSFTRSRPSTPSPFAEKIPKPVVQQLWLFEPVSSLLKEGATESLDMLSPSSGYKFRVLAEFQTLCLEFRVVSLSGENDANLTWPVDVKISLTLQHPHNQLRNVSAAKVKTVKKPLASHGGKSSSEFIHFFKWDVLDNFTDDDELLVKLSLCVVNQK